VTAPEDPEALRRVIHDLERRIATLEDENEALAEGHEDALLLGLVTEQIQNEDGAERILRQGLERVSVLKAIPFCACLDVRGRNATLVQHYCSLTDAMPPSRHLLFSKDVADRLAHDTVVLTAAECGGVNMVSVLPTAFDPTVVVMIPFKSRILPSGAFLFADDRSDRELRRSLVMLHRICDSLIARLDNDALVRELRQLNANLDENVRARTADLQTRNEELLREIAERRRAEEELRQSQKLESIGQLAGGVAHDFNNLLTTILGTVEFLLDDVRPDDRIREDLLIIRDAGVRAAELTRQLLAFGSRQHLEKRVVDLGDLCQGFSRMLRRVIPEDVEVHIDSVHETPAVSVDVGQIEQVLLNLAVNAGDAMPRGGRLDIHVGPVNDGREVAMDVVDEGVGIPPELVERVFEPFFTTKPAGKGTGLGLATAYGIVRQHGGRIDVVSTPGRGSVFTVRLPAASASPTLVREPVGGAESLHGTETVLVVDDDQSVREVVRQGLKRLGYSSVALGPMDALAVLGDTNGRGAAFDALVTDVVMPGVSGPEMARAFSERFPSAGVVFMSGYAGNRVGLPEDAILIEKPVSGVDVAAAVRKAVGRPGGSRAPLDPDPGR
jgi:signal transduction histidine kinase